MDLKGKKVAFLGDSITEGCAASSAERIYHQVIKADLGLGSALNYGVGGTRIAPQHDKDSDMYPENFIIRADKLPADADYVFVFGGTNDYGHGDAKIGAEGDDSPYTFIGGLNNLIKKLTEIYGKNKICFILPLHRFDEEDLYGEGSRTEPTLNLKGYVDIIKSTCEKNRIDYIDLYNNGIPKPETCFGDEFTVDGLHPNDKGHLFIANKIKEYLKK